MAFLRGLLARYRWQATPSSRRTAIRGAILGITVAIIGFGPDYLLGTKSFWSFPPTDLNSHIIGWRSYLLGPWTWPPLVAPRLEQPSGMHMLLMDALPPAAFFAKIVGPLARAIAPTLWLNPFGWWQLVSYALQGAFGALILRRLCPSSPLAALSGAAIAVTEQIFVLRFYHTGLSSHFVILAALWLYLHREEIAERRRWMIASFTGIAAAAMFLHPYLFAMTAAVLAAIVGEWLRARRFRDAAIVAGSALAILVPAMYLGGYFGPETFHVNPGRTITGHGDRWFGYGYKSTDLASFFVPQFSPFVPPVHPLRIDMARDEIAEGWDYLGFGVLALFVLVVVRAGREVGAALRRHAILVVVLLGMVAYAISNRVAFGKVLLVELPLPDAANWIVSQFRSCGRFVWPATYAGTLFVAGLAYRRFTTGWLRFAPPLLVLVQFLDGMGNFTYVRGFTARAEVRFLDWDVFRPVVHAHTGITLLPAHSCVTWDRPIVAWANMELEFLAAEKGLGQTGIRIAKPRRDCLSYPLEEMRQVPDPDRLYVHLRPTFAAERVHYARFGFTCHQFHLGFACSHRLPPNVPGLTPLPSTPNYVLGDTIHFGTAAEDLPLLGEGWSYPEGTHRWTAAPSAFVYLHADRPVSAGAHLHLKAGAAVLAPRPRMSATVRVNGALLGTLDFPASGSQTFDLALPREATGSALLEIEVIPSDVRSPEALGVAPDPRALGLSFTEFRIDPA